MAEGGSIFLLLPGETDHCKKHLWQHSGLILWYLNDRWP